MAESEPGRPMDGKVCMVTGATAGIGLVAASELARRGARVIGVGRSRERCGEAARLILDQGSGASVEYLVADLSSQSEIRRLAQGVKASTGRLDVLLNNAGGIYLERQETADGVERTFAVNHLAYFLLTNLLLDLIKASAPARIINVSSQAHKGIKINFDDLQGKTRYSGWRAYQQSKLANILFTRELAQLREPASLSMRLHPGFVNTKIFRADGFIGWLLRRSADLLAISPEEGAKTSVYLATSPEVENVTGKYFIKEHVASSSAASQDDAAAAQALGSQRDADRLAGLIRGLITAETIRGGQGSERPDSSFRRLKTPAAIVSGAGSGRRGRHRGRRSPGWSPGERLSHPATPRAGDRVETSRSSLGATCVLIPAGRRAFSTRPQRGSPARGTSSSP